MHLDQLTDDECLWEPTKPCWTVRARPGGGWLADWQAPMPDPPPVPTIGWRTWQVGRWWSQTLNATFDGDARRTDVVACPDDTVGVRSSEDGGAPATIDWPADAELTVWWLRQLHERWGAELRGLGEQDLDGFDRSDWLQRGTKPLAHLLVWVNSELTRSAAEIGLLRCLYANAG